MRKRNEKTFAERATEIQARRAEFEARCDALIKASLEFDARVTKLLGHLRRKRTMSIRKDCLYSTGPEVMGRRTLQELSEVCPVWEYATDAHSDDELSFELSWNSEFWSGVVANDSATSVMPADIRWGV